MTEYQLSWENQTLTWGEKLSFDAECEWASADTAAKCTLSKEGADWEWEVSSGISRARAIVRDIGILLAAVRVRLGAADHLEALLNNVEASLALSGREATLPLSVVKMAEDDTRSEITVQAQQIGNTITNWLREDALHDVAIRQFGQKALGHLELRSRCEQHLWTPAVAQLLMGPSGSPIVMQLYNEFLHQIILLRDALLPFSNWQEVPFDLKDIERVKGLRFLEQHRRQFLVELLTGGISHRVIVQFAQCTLRTSILEVGYGFQYRLGTVLPAGIGLPIAATDFPRSLLRWHPVWTVKIGNEPEPEAIAFEYELDDYYSARSNLLDTTLTSVGSDNRLLDTNKAQLIIVGLEQGLADHEMGVQATRKCQLRLKLNTDSGAFEVDLGQAARGHRYLYRSPGTVAGEQLSPITDGSPEAAIQSVEAQHLLALPNLVTAATGIYTIQTKQNSLLQWMLLGKLYPENIIAADQTGWGDIQTTVNTLGKQFGAKFVIEG
ncbi:hypothetical protein [Paenibacillus agri]|uniref:Uncharacterized protein n=1 Tax=Paenibacillus agri TaxID=2744309 RepID=A0A850EG54_9BACL|nr:hypothetical protein [Paenibacillus agri]NUU60125.1 hypothetical protein [Paenibacillus agri]